MQGLERNDAIADVSFGGRVPSVGMATTPICERTVHSTGQRRAAGFKDIGVGPCLRLRQFGDRKTGGST